MPKTLNLENHVFVGSSTNCKLFKIYITMDQFYSDGGLLIDKSAYSYSDNREWFNFMSRSAYSYSDFLQSLYFMKPINQPINTAGEV